MAACDPQKTRVPGDTTRKSLQRKYFYVHLFLQSSTPMSVDTGFTSGICYKFLPGPPQKTDSVARMEQEICIKHLSQLSLYDAAPM